jgi:ubiquinone biosynthesis protein Coq4
VSGNPTDFTILESNPAELAMLHLLISPKQEGKSPLDVQKFWYGMDREARGLSAPQLVRVGELRSMPVGTFGRAWADFLDRHQLQPLTCGPPRQQFHDGIHVLTGYGTDAIGKLQVQAFLLGAKLRPVNLVRLLELLAAADKQLQQQADRRYNCPWKYLWPAYQRGRNSLFDPNDWEPELLWPFPLQDVRDLFRI